MLHNTELLLSLIFNSCVAELTQKQVSQWMYFSKPLLVNIFKRTEFSQRHEDFYFSARKRREQGCLNFSWGVAVFIK